MATIRDVAKLAGVSVSTISRYLNKSGYVNSETEQNIKAAIDKLKYEPSVVARGLAGKQTNTIALILPDISNLFFSDLARAVEDVASTYGYTVIFCNTDDQGGKERNYIEVLKKKYIDGFIFASNTLTHEDTEALHKRSIPYVCLDRGPSDELSSVVRSKNLEGAKMAVLHLLEMGYTKIAHIHGPQHSITAKDRLAGYEESVRGFAWYSPTLMEAGDFRMASGMKAAEELLRRHPDIDAIFAGNDLMAIGALKVLHRMGIKVGEQVGVCGFDGIQTTEITEPELTTIAQPIYDMGALITRILIKKIEGSLVEDQIYELDVSLMARASTYRRR
ncbi:LacI family DNA-binding transcriptional regulator [Paenibacillus sediminis]|uniref:LacI family transcriptional regulator n=1 Tax=Paenibacillus sediminis TaxID=664909 RepID=A0ABS4H1W9_9BACL|nr:LacI family DNA-binding transcriptional regulator [Paenibacillus sediminis]MBP1936515.1 LacI family transcriptional regulator [Paenibacillus sediminis]